MFIFTSVNNAYQFAFSRRAFLQDRERKILNWSATYRMTCIFAHIREPKFGDGRTYLVPKASGSSLLTEDVWFGRAE